jgi:hypothetical protein
MTPKSVIHLVVTDMDLLYTPFSAVIVMIELKAMIVFSFLKFFLIVK